MAMNKDELLKNFINEEGKFHVGFDTVMKSLRPNAKFTIATNGTNGYNFLHWEDSTGLYPPTIEEIEAEQKRQNEFSEYYEYFQNRIQEYPLGFEQLDILWHDINSGKPLKEGIWFNQIKEIKEKYPKPEGPAPE
jgi:hypothetical protein